LATRRTITQYIERWITSSAMEMDRMRFGQFTFGSIEIDGTTYGHDVVIDRGRVRKRKKGLSRPFRGILGHIPLSLAEKIPWKCERLVVGSGADGALPVMNDVAEEARRNRRARRRRRCRGDAEGRHRNRSL